jgi:hypothetical protein
LFHLFAYLNIREALEDVSNRAGRDFLFFKGQSIQIRAFRCYSREDLAK